MSQPVELGSVLGGRYKVTALVLTSAEEDLVLDGVDQVLKRPVSILVASPANASQVATSAREIATGERHGAMQVLDLSIADGQTYLVTNKAAPADLLDLVITRDAPYVEPFFTDTLGSELFGAPRSHEPEASGNGHHGSVQHDNTVRPGLLDRFSGRLNRRREDVGPAGGHPVDNPGQDDAEVVAGASVPPQAAVPPPPALPPAARQAGATQAGTGPADSEPPTAEVAQPETPKTAAQPAAVRPPSSPPQRPKVTLWSDDDYDDEPNSRPDSGLRQAAAGAAGGAAVQASAAAAPGTAAVPGPEAAAAPAPAPSGGFTEDARDGASSDTRPASTFPAAAAGAGAGPAGVAQSAVRPEGAGEAARDAVASASGGNDTPKLDDRSDEDDDARNNPRTARWLLVGVLAAALVVAVVLAFNALGNGILRGVPQAGAPDQTPAPGAASSAPAGGSATASEPAVAPQITGLTRVVPDSPDLDADNDATLPQAIDDNPASYWRSYSYSQANFGGFADNLALVVALEDESTITQVDITQLNGSGGGFSVLLNDEPELDGADEVAQGSFTGPNMTIPVPPQDGEPAQAEYVIINFTELPRLSNGTAGRPFGLRIADIRIS